MTTLQGDLVSSLVAAVRRFRERSAVRLDNEVFSYAQLERHSARAAELPHDAGVRQADPRRRRRGPAGGDAARLRGPRPLRVLPGGPLRPPRPPPSGRDHRFSVEGVERRITDLDGHELPEGGRGQVRGPT